MLFTKKINSGMKKAQAMKTEKIKKMMESKKQKTGAK
jgi:hypothetical protein